NSVLNKIAPSFTQLFEIRELRAQSQAKDTVIVKLKEQIKLLKGNVDDSKVKIDMDEIETLNIELEHRVTKLVAENDHLKQTYKQLYDSIKPKRVQSKEQCDALIKQVNIKSREISDLNAKLQEQGLVIAALKNELRKIKGKALVNEDTVTHSVAPNVSKDNMEPITPKLLNKRTAHSSYIKHTQEEALVLRDIVEHVKANYPQDSLLESAFRSHEIKSQEKLGAKTFYCARAITAFRQYPGNDRILQTPSSNEGISSSSPRNVHLVNKRNGKVFTQIVPSRKPIVLESESPKPVVNLVYSRKPRKNKNTESVSKPKVVQIVLWLIGLSVQSTMTRERISVSPFLSVNSLAWHNLFSVGLFVKFCDSNLEVAFCQHTCFIRNLEGVDLLTGSRGDNIYTLPLGNMMASSPICLLSKASKTKSWLWHRRLSHLNFGAINHLARHGLVRGLPKLKFEKDHLCSACALRKSLKKPHKPKSEDTNHEKLYLLHMDLCGPMCVASVNGKKYILVIVDDYSRFTWVKCLRSKDEAPTFIINFLKMIQVRLKETVRRIRTDNGTEFVNQTLREYYEKVGISHETSVARSPQQNGVVERRNRTLIEAARTMLIYAKAPLFLWAEAVATACYTQNRSMIRRRHGKTPYELLHDKPPDLSYLHVFGALCYPTNDSENLGKLQPKADIGIFIGYAPTKKAFRIYNRRTRRIIETIHVDFDELTAMASEHSSSGPALHEMTSQKSLLHIPEVFAPAHVVLLAHHPQHTVEHGCTITSNDPYLQCKRKHHDFERLERFGKLVSSPDKAWSSLLSGSIRCDHAGCQDTPVVAHLVVIQLIGDRLVAGRHTGGRKALRNPFTKAE
ncbi:retrovirus-related pol polyprotein from transposon TNT 1-94, partial [Tanacetum coccineum]